ncbi:MAG TPA: type VI secretion system ATPase TssH [Telluria sp.]|nr:type VI secretion system ATPase TssH [Telluria sp.]
MDINLKTLISKLNGVTRAAATRAASICMGLGQYEVDIEHVFLALLEQPDCDVAVVARRCGISTMVLESDLREEISRFAAGSARTPVFSRHLPTLLEHAWLLASLDAERPHTIRSGHLLLALLTEPDLAQLAKRGSRLFAKFPRERLKHEFERLTEGSCEATETAPAPPAVDGVTELKAVEGTPALDQYTTCLTQLAREGKLDPVIGRDAEIRQSIDILMRRRQNNPILTGEAGVGKTAVVEGLALRVAAGDVPPALREIEIHTLDMGLLQAGASVKGEFENRLKGVIAEVRRSARPLVLFIDEAHTIIGAGGAAGQNDAANLLKPALARGELRTIAATTWSEYKKYFDKDAALARRFQVVKVEEPDEETACAMLRAMAPLMETHFQVRVLDEAVEEAVRLARRYIGGRQLPDKAVGVLDTACARVALGRDAAPAPLESLTRRGEQLDAQLTRLERESTAGEAHSQRIETLRAVRASVAQEEARLRERWQRERALAAEVTRLRDQGDGRAMQATVAELHSVQGDQPLVPLHVDAKAIADVVSAWTGIPLGRMVKDEIAAVMQLDAALAERVIGQRQATDAIAQRVRMAGAKMEEPDKPRAVFLFAGPSGVGKTETALTLAELLYGGERKLVTINMSEYQEAHSVSGLKGAPPGYVGYGDGGVLTEAVRRQPYSVVLFDEVEKAHPDVLELFYQVFDKGTLDDGEGRAVDFRNTIIIMTSNAGSAQVMQTCLNQSVDERPDPQTLANALRPALARHFKPAFLGRVTLVPFYPLADDVLARIVAHKLDRIGRRLAENHRASFAFDDSVVETVLSRCTDADAGARNIDAILNGTLLPAIADEVLARMADGGTLTSVRVSAEEGGAFRLMVDAA